MSKQSNDKTEKDYKFYQQEFFKNPSFNPESGRKIGDTGNIYKTLVNKYGDPKKQNSKDKNSKDKKSKDEDVKDVKLKDDVKKSKDVKNKKSKNEKSNDEDVKDDKSKDVKNKKSKNEKSNDEDVKDDKSKDVKSKDVKDDKSKDVKDKTKNEKSNDEDIKKSKEVKNSIDDVEKSDEEKSKYENIKSNILLFTSIDKLVFMNKNSIEECDETFWIRKFDNDALPVIKKQDNFESWVKHYKKVEQAKIEIIKLVKVAIVTSTPLITIKFKLDKKYSHLLPNMNTEENGDVIINCNLVKTKPLPYLNLDYTWTISFEVEDNYDDTVEQVEVTFRDILLLLTSLEYYMMYEQLDMVIVSDDFILSRKELTDKTATCFETTTCYKLLDNEMLYQ